MGQPLVSRNRKPKKSGFLLCSIHSFFEGLKTASLASHRPLNKLLLSAKCFNNVRTAATKMADNERHFVSNFTNFQIKSSNKMNGKLATWQLVYKSGETSWWRCHWLIKFCFFFSRRAVDRKCTVAWQPDPFRQRIFKNISSRVPTERKKSWRWKSFLFSATSGT